MSKKIAKPKKYEKGCEPLTTTDIRALTDLPTYEAKNAMLHDIERCIETMMEDGRLEIFIQDNGEFSYELTPKGILWAKKQRNPV